MHINYVEFPNLFFSRSNPCKLLNSFFSDRYRYIFHPLPQVVTYVLDGLIAPHTFPDSCITPEQDIPFDYAIEGGSSSLMELDFFFQTTGPNSSVCSLVPDNTTLTVTSHLQSTTDHQKLPQNHTLKFESNHIVLNLFVGEPNSAGDSIEDFVRRVDLSIINTKLWEEPVAQKGIKALVLGHNKYDKDASFVASFGSEQGYV